MALTDSQRAEILEPPISTADLAGVGGQLRSRLDDFRVEEVPAYSPSGEGDHVFLLLEKHGLTTEDAARVLASHLGLRRGEIGVAGLKDKHAVTRQWVSVPRANADKLGDFEHDAITLGEGIAHANKLRRGHLHGNRFTLTVRELAATPALALERAQKKLAQLVSAGIPNYFGPQRFGFEGRNLDKGLAILASGRKRKRADIVVSAGQSALFNLYALERARRGLGARVLGGDVLKKAQTGGLFRCADAPTDQTRLDAGELVLTGPMFGSKMMAPPAGTDAEQLEREILALGGLSTDALKALGRGVPGTRRPLLVRPADASVEIDGDGLCFSFTLPPGSYATVVMNEIMSTKG